MRIWAIVAIFVGWCGSLQAGPLELGQVSGDAKWLVHLDVDAMRESSLMEKAYLAGTQQWTELESLLAIACAEVGVDPRVDLHGITVFGTKLGKLEGVAIVDAKMNPKAMVARAMAESGYTSTKYGGHEIHAWTDGEETVAGAFFRPSLLVVARSDKEVRHALDVLQGKAPSLTGKPRPLAAKAEAGTMLLAWAEGLADSPLPFQSAAIKKTEAIAILVGENQGEVFVAVRLVARTSDTAKKMLAVLEGVRAAIELQYEADAALMNVTKKLRFSTADKTVIAEVRSSADELWKHVERVFATVKAK